MNELGRRLCTSARDRATTAVEWRDGARRRLFFFEDGALVLAQSNLKSESPERVTTQTPGLDADQTRRATLRLRLENAFAESGGDVNVGPAILPAKGEVIDVLSFALERSWPALSPDLFPKSTAQTAAWADAIPGEPALAHYVKVLDGSRPIEDVLTFGPSDPEKTERLLRLLFELGGIEDAGGEAQGYVVRMVGTRSAAPVDDIAALIAGELQGGVAAARAPVDPVEAAFGSALTRIRSATDHFGVLGVSWRDPGEVIRRSYFALARELHPDRFGSESAEVQAVATELFDKVRAAWEMLGDDSKREAYIAKVIRGEKTEEEKVMDKVQAILDGEASFKRGLNEFHAGRLTQAHELFQAAAERLPDEAEFQAYAGFTTFKLNQGRDERKAEEGVERLVAALKANDKLDAGHVLLGLVHRARGDDVSAKRAFIQALKLKPSNPDAARELKRLEQRPSAPPPSEASGGLFSRFFGKKK